MADSTADRLSIPSSAMSEQEERRNRQYGEEARNQDLSDADDEARDRDIPSRAPRTSNVSSKGDRPARPTDDHPMRG